MLLGFGAALCRSELVALRLGDVATVPGRGLSALVRQTRHRSTDVALSYLRPA